MELEITLNYFFKLELSSIKSLNYSETYFKLDSEEATVCTYCGSGFILLICVQLYKQNRYRDTEIKGYVKGVESSSIYPIRIVMLCMSKVLKEAHFCEMFSYHFMLKCKLIHIFPLISKEILADE